MLDAQVVTRDGPVRLALDGFWAIALASTVDSEALRAIRAALGPAGSS